ncbi:hypothetical protein FACS1894158_01030 [Betaproteobacteria bacterium]|nr:hypothetical protein FACS1894158_01030 [Betaproteobacteria bacterium]
MDHIIDSLALAALTHWRVTLCFVFVGSISILVTRSTDWLSFGQGFAFALSGFFLGIALEDQTPPRQMQLFSTLTARLTAVFVGVGWGLASGFMGKPAISGFILLVVAGSAWFWYWAISTVRATIGEAALRLVLAGIAHTIAAFAISM